MNKQEIVIPLNDWYVGKRKYNLSMNTYRNLHHQVSSRLKRDFKEYMMQFKIKSYDRPIKIHYTIYFKDQRKRDLMNFVAVVDKFALVALVERKVIQDDNYKHVIGYTVDYGGKRDINQIVMEIIET